MIDDTRHGHHQQHHPSRSTVRPYLLNISDDISLAGRQDLAVRPENVDEFQTLVFGAGSYTSCQRVHPSVLALRTAVKFPANPLWFGMLKQLAWELAWANDCDGWMFDDDWFGYLGDHLRKPRAQQQALVC